MMDIEPAVGVLSVINGLVFVITGGLGVFSAKKPSHRGTIQALMALTIISACLTVLCLVLDVLGVLDAVSARYE